MLKMHWGRANYSKGLTPWSGLSDRPASLEKPRPNPDRSRAEAARLAAPPPVPAPASQPRSAWSSCRAALSGAVLDRDRRRLSVGLSGAAGLGRAGPGSQGADRRRDAAAAFLFLAIAARLARSVAMSDATRVLLQASERLFAADDIAAANAARLARVVRRELDGLNTGLDVAFQRMRTLETIAGKADRHPGRRRRPRPGARRSHRRAPRPGKRAHRGNLATV